MFLTLTRSDAFFVALASTSSRIMVLIPIFCMIVRQSSVAVVAFVTP